MGTSTPPDPARRRVRDAGMGLAELIVALGIFTLVITVLGSAAVVATRAAGGATTRLGNATQAELGLAGASKLLRTAVLPKQLEDTTCTTCDETAVVNATGVRVSFYGNLGRTPVGPTLVTLSVREDPNVPGTAILEETLIDPTSLGEGRYTFCNPAASGCAKRRVLARSLVWPAPALFAYYDTDGLLMPLASTSANLMATQRAKISSIDVSVTAQTRPGQTRWPSLTSVSRVRLPNVEINLQVEDEDT